jgi:hypothetical protein
MLDPNGPGQAAAPGLAPFHFAAGSSEVWTPSVMIIDNLCDIAQKLRRYTQNLLRPHKSRQCRPRVRAGISTGAHLSREATERPFRPRVLGQEANSIPFRREKWSVLAGGTRVPAIVIWPGSFRRAGRAGS